MEGGKQMRGAFSCSSVLPRGCFQATAQEKEPQREPVGLAGEAKVARTCGAEYRRGRSCTEKALEVSREFPESLVE